MSEIRKEAVNGRHPPLAPETAANVETLGSADMVVGIPSLGSERTIGHVVGAAARGMAEHFPELRGVVVCSDGGSTDRTRETVRETPVAPGIEKIVSGYEGLPGKGSALATVFEIARRLGARVVIVLDSDLRSVTPDWIRLLADPLYRMCFGFVTPDYVRHKYDGTITNALAYPLTRALFGQIVRQPIGGDFAMTGELASLFASSGIHERPLVSAFGIDLWMTTTAIVQGFRLCQASLGIKLHDPKDPLGDLGPMFGEVVGTAFSLAAEHEVKWKGTRDVRPVELFEHQAGGEPEPVLLDPAGLAESFRSGVRQRRDILTRMLAPEQLERVLSEAGRKDSAVSIDPGLWARIVYDAVVAYSASELEPELVTRALLPLYHGRTASFAIEADKMDASEAEQVIEHVADTFAREKPYLVERWDRTGRAGAPPSRRAPGGR